MALDGCLSFFDARQDVSVVESKEVETDTDVVVNGAQQRHATFRHAQFRAQAFSPSSQRPPWRTRWT
jgi:hypothetical protein